MRNSREVRAGIESMLWAFRSRAPELFEATRPNEYPEYGRALYGVLYVKPTKHVGRLLSVDREILVLATSFQDLQARTVQFAIELIDGSGGRLEHSAAIIAHRDPLGNRKLKNWGREQGLTVIPMFMPDYDLPSGQVLSRLLLSEFYSHDPFDVTGPVSDDNQFYGRRDEAQDLARQLQTGQVRACLGIRKIGKTSILHRVIGVIEDLYRASTVFVDCSKDIIWGLRAGQLLAAIAEAVLAAAESPHKTAEVGRVDRSVTVADGYRELSEALRNKSTTVVLIFDEVDYITPGSPTAIHWRQEFNPFWRNLRAVFQEAARGSATLSVLVSGVSSKWFRCESIEGVENAALAFIPEEYLFPLSPGASIAMIKSLGETSGLLFDEAAATLVARTCGFIPFWMRKAGSFIHSAIDVDSRPRNLAEESVALLLQTFLQSEGAGVADTALAHLFRVFPELRPAAAECLEGRAAQVPGHLRTVLEKYGVIHHTDGVWKVSGRMMQAGLSQSLSKTEGNPSSPLGLFDVKMRFETVDEWSDESPGLARIGIVLRSACAGLW